MLRRIMSFVLAMTMVVGMVPVTVLAAETECVNHSTHEGCSYRDAVAEQICVHTAHDESCEEEVTVCLHTQCGESCTVSDEAGQPRCIHECTLENGCVAMGIQCAHREDGSCCYVPGQDAVPCDHSCELCDPQMCSHGEMPSECQVCNPSAPELCQHEEVKEECADCNLPAPEVCEHDEVKAECMVCNPLVPEVCEHDEVKAECSACNPPAQEICEHDALKAECIICCPAVFEDAAAEKQIVTASEMDTQAIGDFKYTVSDSNVFAYITGYSGTETELVIPEKISGYTVYGIADSAFSGNKTLRSITLPESVKQVGNWAFANCSVLNSVTLSSQISSLGEKILAHTPNVKKLSVPAGLIIGSNVLLYSHVEELSFAEGTTEITSSFATGAEYLSKVIIPDTVTEIGNWVFQDCTALKSVAIPGSVKTIGSSSFEGCTALEAVFISDGVQTLGSGVFNGCSALTDVRLPDSVLVLDNWLFKDCISLQEIDLPDALSTIGFSVFNGCSLLKRITIPSTVTVIDCFAFSGCTSLTDIAFEGNPPAIDSTAFGKVTAYVTYPLEAGTWSAENKKDYAGSLTWLGNHGSCGENVYWGLEDQEHLIIYGLGSMMDTTSGAPWDGYCSQITRVTVDDGVTSVGINAFSGYESLASVSLADSIADIGAGAFCDTAITFLTLPDNLKTLGEDAFSGTEVMELVIPATLSYITDGVKDSAIRKIVFKDGTVRVPDGVAQGANGLSQIIIPESVTTVGQSAFAGCTALSDITIPEAVTFIGADAFANCTALTQIEFYGIAPSVDSAIFSGVTAKALYPMWDDTWTEAAMQSYGGNITWEITFDAERDNQKYSYTIGSDNRATITGYTGKTKELYIPAQLDGYTVSVIGDNAFRDKTFITYVAIPETVKYIDNDAFRGCTALKTIELPSSLEDIWGGAFQNTGLTKLVLPEGIEALGRGILAGTENVTELTIPKSVTYTEGPLSGSFVKTLTIEEGMTKIPDKLAKDAANLTAITIPESVTEIGAEAFSGCMSLNSIDIPGKVRTIRSGAFRNTGLDALVLPDTVYSMESGILDGSIGVTKFEIPKDIYNAAYALEGSSIAELTFAQGCSWIPESIARNLQTLIKVTIPDSVSGISSYAFAGCTSLKEIVFEGSPPYIRGEYVFLDVTAVAYHPNGRWKLEDKKNYHGNLTWKANSGTASLENPDYIYVLNMGGGSASITGYVGTEPALTIPSSLDGYAVTQIAADAFENNKTITSVKIPQSVWSVGDMAFLGCSNLQSISLSDSVKSVGDYAFSNTGLTSLELPENISGLGQGILAGTAGVKSLSVPKGVEYSGWGLLEGSYVETLIFEEGSKEVPDGIAINAAHLTLAFIPDSVESIGAYAFKNCEVLEKIVLPKSLTYIGSQAFAENNISEMIFRSGPPTTEDDAMLDSFVWAFYDSSSYWWEVWIEATEELDENFEGTHYWFGGFVSWLSRWPVLLDIEVTHEFDPLAGTVKMQWENVMGAERYMIYRKANKPSVDDEYYRIATTSRLSFVDDTIEPGNIYYYLVRPYADQASSKYWDTFTIYYDLNKPELGYANVVSTGQIKLIWEPAVYVSEYRIYRAEDTGEFSQLAEVSGNQFTYTDTSAQPGNRYRYKIQALSANHTVLDSEISDEITAAYILRTPAGITLKNITNSSSIRISWKESPGAVGYRIFRTNDRDKEELVIDVGAGELSYVDQAESGVTYTYRVCALAEKEEANSVCSSERSLRAGLDKTVVTYTNDGPTGKIILNWESREDAAQYWIYRSTKLSGSYSLIKKTTETSYWDKGVSSGKTYYYKVRAVAADKGIKSADSDVLTAYCGLLQPVVTVRNDTATGKTKLSWKSVSGASQYRVLRAQDDAEFSEIALLTSKSTSFTDETAEVGVEYTYRVQALSKSGNYDSAYQNDARGLRHLAQPKLTKIGNDLSSGKVTLTWNPVEGASGYQILRSLSKSKGYERVGTAQETAFTDTEAQPGKTYYYQVAALHANEDAASAASAYKSQICKLAMPVISGVSNDKQSGKPVIEWKLITGATKYIVYRAASEGGKYTKTKTFNAPKDTETVTYTDTSAKPGTAYYYRVVAAASSSKTNSAQSYASSGVLCRLAIPVLKVSNSASTGKFTLSWNSVSGASRYILSRDGEEILTTKSRTYSNASAVRGESCLYTIQAVYDKNSAVNSETSETVKATYRLSRPKITKTGNDPITGKVTLAWNPVEGASGFQILRSVSKSKGYVPVGTVSDTSFTDSEAQPGKTWYYQVVALHSNEDAASAASAYKSQICKLERPEIIGTANDEANGKNVIRWECIEGAAKYMVYRAASEKGRYTLIKTFNAPRDAETVTYTDTSAKPGTTYYYKVAAGTGSSKANSAQSAASDGVLCRLAVPVLKVSSSASTGKFTLSWNGVSGASRYILCRNGEKVITTKSRSYTDKSAVMGESYFYTIQAVFDKNSAVDSKVSEEVKATFRLPQTKIKKVSNDPVSGKPIIQWNGVEGASGYRILRSASKSKGYEPIGTAVGSSFTDTGAVPGKTWYYQVVALHSNEDAASAASAYKSRICKLAAPEIVGTSNDGSSGKPVISWEKIEGATKYMVYRAASEAGRYTLIKTVTAPKDAEEISCKDTSAKTGKTYYYKVAAAMASSAAKSSDSAAVPVQAK